jgi:hypothetical protein
MEGVMIRKIPLKVKRLRFNKKGCITRFIDDGIMVVPIPAEQRDQADADMRLFINHHKEH